MNVLGINAFHGDASIALIKNGLIEFALEEERLNRIKHSAGFPVKSLEFCLKYNNLELNDIGLICFNFNPKANFFPKIKYSISNINKKKRIFHKIKNQFNKINSLNNIQDKYFPNFKNKFKYFDHHLCHLASSYYISPFENSSLVSIDGFGDFSSSYVGMAQSNKIKVLQKSFFPHSPGLFYLGVTQYLNFNNYGDEYKVMGLSAYGKPKYLKDLRKLIYTKNKKIYLNLDYFNHDKNNFSYTWKEGKPKNSKVFSEKFDTIFKKHLNIKDNVDEFNADFAASAQKVYEEVLFKMLNEVFTETKNPNLCLSGGCAMNSLANGKILENTNFRNLFIPPSPGDSGGAIGAAMLGTLKNSKINKNSNPFLGPKFNHSEIIAAIKNLKEDGSNFQIKEFSDKNRQAEFIVNKYLIKNKIVAIFQGGCEWGPRALGNRSIIADPRNKEIKDIINRKIKLREPFRPFAPTILKDQISKWFNTTKDFKFMSEVISIKKEKSNLVPAVVHVDGTCRLQTLEKDNENLYYLILEYFFKTTNVPILLNTSFNINEPIVFSPKDAVNTFKKSDIDCLNLENFTILRN